MTVLILVFHGVIAGRVLCGLERLYQAARGTGSTHVTHAAHAWDAYTNTIHQ